MAVSIRLQRCGKNNRPFYHIVAADRRKKRDGRFIEKLGYYDPLENPSKMVFKEDRIKYWYGKGALLSPAVSTMMRKNKVTLERFKTNVGSKK